MKLLHALTILATTTSAFISKSQPAPLLLSHLTMAMSTSTNLKEAKQRIFRAISIGAPAYNGGNIQKCAEVYTNTASEIVREKILPPMLETKLMNAVDKNDLTYNEQAWAMRQIFDSILDYTLPIVPEKENSSNNKYEPFTSSQLGNPIKVMDNVMGGISTGQWNSHSNTFSGTTSLANNGGFASLRWRFNNVQNWSYAKGIYIQGLKHSKPEEHTFSILLKDEMCERVRLANFKVVFANPDGADGPLLIPFGEFNQMEQMGRAMVGAPVFNPAGVTELGLMAIKPTVVGDFKLGFPEWGLYT